MYSGLQMHIANNYNVPQYLFTPVYTIGNFLINPFNMNEFPVFPFTSFCSQSTYANVNQNPSECASTLASDPNTKIRQMEAKEKPEIQVTPPKKRSLNRKKNKKIIQKDTRNVISNLLKIFFKNLLDLRIWDKFLESLVKKHKFSTSLKSFYLWIKNFKINYKNYIKAKEIEFLLKDKDCRDYQLLFRALLKHFVYNEGINHCLTTRKIGRTAIGRHVEGLRQINNLFVLSEI